MLHVGERMKPGQQPDDGYHAKIKRCNREMTLGHVNSGNLVYHYRMLSILFVFHRM